MPGVPCETVEAAGTSAAACAAAHEVVKVLVKTS